MVGNLKVWQTALQLFIHVLEAGWDGHTHSYTEAHPVSLIGAVVGVLTDNHHLDLGDACRM